MNWDPDFKPRLRPLEAFAIPGGDSERIGLRDPAGLSEVVVSLSAAALHVMALMDGSNTCAQIRARVRETVGANLPESALQNMLAQLDKARFLEGNGFESYYSTILEEYRRAGVRDMPRAAALGITDDAASTFEDILGDSPPANPKGTLVGLIAPHLDYTRGHPCYAAAYSTLKARRKSPDRVVILGTNHFGRSPSVVATANRFRTPLGTTAVDVEFLEKLEQVCGNLRAYELDHVREHSVELQVTWLQYLFGANEFEIVPFLCPDPTGPTGTAPATGKGVDLEDFAEALGAVLAEGRGDTLLVAGADLSHAGSAFGDSRPLDDAYLDEIRTSDLRALSNLASNDPAAWVSCLARDGNPTRVCSAGCIFVLMTALRGLSGNLLRYHQAVDRGSGTCVTCAAVAFAGNWDD